jgi:hypothetical protein
MVYVCSFTWTKKEHKFYLKPHPDVVKLPVTDYLACLQNGFKEGRSIHFVMHAHNMKLLWW